jgi:hypothetical protein
MSERVANPRFPTGKRAVAIVVLLALLVIGAIVAVATGGDDGPVEEPATDTTTATLPTGPVSDELVATALLPTVGALGPDWVETARDDEPVTAEQDPADPCAVGPIPDGVLIRAEQRRLQGGEVQETLSITAGVLAEGASPPDLTEVAVLDCLRSGLEAAVAEGGTVSDVAGAPPAPPAGAELTVARFAVTTDAGPGGTFDFVLLRRGRGVVLGLLPGVPGVEATPLGEVVDALDVRLDAAAGRLG